MPPVVITKDVPIDNCYELMNRCRLVRLPIVRSFGAYEGVVERGTVVNFQMRECPNLFPEKVRNSSTLRIPASGSVIVIAAVLIPRTLRCHACCGALQLLGFDG